MDPHTISESQEIRTDTTPSEIETSQAEVIGETATTQQTTSTVVVDEPTRPQQQKQVEVQHHQINIVESIKEEGLEKSVEFIATHQEVHQTTQEEPKSENSHHQKAEEAHIEPTHIQLSATAQQQTIVTQHTFQTQEVVNHTVQNREEESTSIPQPVPFPCLITPDDLPKQILGNEPAESINTIQEAVPQNQVISKTETVEKPQQQQPAVPAQAKSETVVEPVKTVEFYTEITQVKTETFVQNQNDAVEGQVSNVQSEPVNSSNPEQQKETIHDDNQAIIEEVKPQPKVEVQPPYTPADRLVDANKLKLIGNDHYVSKNYQLACEMYVQALSIAHPDFYKTQSQELRSEMAQFNIAVLNNVGACYFQLRNYPLASGFSSEVLKIQPSNVKALYRRALCNFEMSRFLEALSDIKQAYTLEPNRDIHQAYDKILKAYNQDIEAKKGLYQSMVSGKKTEKAESVRSEQPMPEPQTDPKEEEEDVGWPWLVGGVLAIGAVAALCYKKFRG